VRHFLLGVQASGAGYGDPLRRRTPGWSPPTCATGWLSGAVALAPLRRVAARGEPDDTATELERDRLRAARLAEAQPPADEPWAGLDGGIPVHPVCDTVEAVELDGRRRLRCRLCHHDTRRL